MEKTYIRLENLSFSYDERKESNIFTNLSLEFKKGEFVAFLGPSGCGKSTLLRLIGGLLNPTQGSISIEHIGNNPVFGFVFQKPVLLPWRTVESNLKLPLELMNKNAMPTKALLEMVGLWEYKRFYPHELSGGMQQRVAIARALSFNPEILLMDEPFSALDEITRQNLNLELLNIWKSTGVTIFFVTHSIQEALYLADRVIVFSKPPVYAKMDTLVPFERPRNYFDVISDNRFKELQQCIRDML